MKKTALLLILLILPFELLADTVSLQRARSLAERFMAADNATRAGSLALSYTYDVHGDLMGETRSAGDPAIYVFNRPGGGFVLVSGDDSFTPILGYSYTGSFQDDATMPANLRAWISEMTGSINDLRAEHAKATGAIAEQWSRYESTTRAGGIKRANTVVLHETALWNQGDPFNRYCPVITGDNPGLSITGCVATSIGILMRYYKYPARALKDFPERKGNGYTIPFRKADYDYDWDNMLMTYKNGYTDEQANACARLLADIGQIGNLSYGVDGTGGVTRNVIGAMIDYYGYDKNMVFMSRYYFSNNEWIAKLKAELDIRPLSHTGRSESGGHAFVADGYDDEDRIHINWGWGGSGNGFFSIYALGNYTSTHCATFGFRPNENGSYIPLYCYYRYTRDGIVYNGIELLSAAITPNVDFTVRLGAIHNNGYASHTTEIGIGHCNKNGHLKRIISSQTYNISSLGPGYLTWFPSITCRITDPVETGDLVRAYFRADNGEWTPIYCDSTEELIDVIELDRAITAEGSSVMTYNKAAQTLTIKTKDGVTITVASMAGGSTDGYVTINGSTVVMDLAKMPAGTYTVTLMSSGGIKSFQIVR